MKIITCGALLALFAFALSACHKHDDAADTNDPVLTITSPAADASIAGAVNIAGTTTDESLHEMSITVTQDSDNTPLYKIAPEVHDKTSYTISETWTPSGIAAETAVTLTIVVEDHSDHSVTKTVKFKVKP